MTSGKLRLEVTRFGLRDFVDEAAELASGRTGTAGAAVEVRADEGAELVADRARLLQVLNNLIGNALKFSPPGGRVVVQCSREDGGARFLVEDQGPGIAPELHERIFERFYRAEAAAASPERGLGLGLRIAKDIVVLHGGSIWVDSSIGKGSRFHVRIPDA